MKQFVVIIVSQSGIQRFPTVSGKKCRTKEKPLNQEVSNAHWNSLETMPNSPSCASRNPFLKLCNPVCQFQCSLYSVIPARKMDGQISP